MRAYLVALLCSLLSNTWRTAALRPTPLRALAVSGKDALPFLHAMLSAEVSTLADGRCVDACLLTGASDITDLVTVARRRRGVARARARSRSADEPARKRVAPTLRGPQARADGELLAICEATDLVRAELEKRRVTEDVVFVESDLSVVDVTKGGDHALAADAPARAGLTFRSQTIRAI